VTTTRYGHTAHVGIRTRIRLAVHVLRGRPLAFRLHIVDGAITWEEGDPPTWVYGNTFEGGPTLKGNPWGKP
jgi:hypothetical protein